MTCLNRGDSKVRKTKNPRANGAGSNYMNFGFGEIENGFADEIHHVKYVKFKMMITFHRLLRPAY